MAWFLLGMGSWLYLCMVPLAGIKVVPASVRLPENKISSVYVSGDTIAVALPHICRLQFYSLDSSEFLYGQFIPSAGGAGDVCILDMTSETIRVGLPGKSLDMTLERSSGNAIEMHSVSLDTKIDWLQREVNHAVPTAKTYLWWQEARVHLSDEIHDFTLYSPPWHRLNQGGIAPLVFALPLVVLVLTEQLMTGGRLARKRRT
ncbi:MAG: hypothetical protein AAF288_10120 [Planctomycetota bacterium]